MKIIKGKKVVPSHHAREYKFRLNFMIGDADGYEEEIIYIEEDHPDLERFLIFLDKCNRSRDPYSIEDHGYFVESFIEDDVSEISFDWPYEPYGDDFCSFDGFEITYFDKNGQEYHTTTEK